MKSIISFLLSSTLVLTLSAQGTLIIEMGASFIIEGELTLNLTNSSLIQNGEFIADHSTIVLDGEKGISKIESSFPISIYQLVVDKGQSNILLEADLNIEDQISMQTGLLDLNGHQIELGETGTLMGETDASHIMTSSPRGGEIIANAYLFSPEEVMPGKLGLSINSEEMMGLTTVIRGHEAQKFPHGNGISRYYDIHPEFNQDLDATLRFQYLNSELGDLANHELLLYQSSDHGTSWSKVNSYQGIDSNNWLEVHGIHQLGRVSSSNEASTQLPNIDLYQDILIGPNPVEDILTVQIHVIHASDIEISLLNMQGKQVLNKSMSLQKGNNHVQLEMRNLASGMYLLHFPGSSLPQFKVVRR